MLKNKIKMTLIVITVISIVLLILLLLDASLSKTADSPVNEEHEESTICIGFSQTDCKNPWRIIQLISFKESAKTHGYELIYYEPEEDSVEWQIENLQLLMQDNPDYLVISPKDLSALKSILLEASNMGIGIIFIDTEKVADDDIYYLTRISSNYAAEGRLCAKVLAEYFDGKPANILEIAGAEELHYTKIRSASFEEELTNYPDMNIVSTVIGNFDSDSVATAMENVISDKSISFDAIFVHSDEAGIGALQALKVAGKDISKIPIVSINGSQDALKAIIAGEYLATVTSSPNIGTIVMSAISQHQNGYTLPEWILIPNQIYDQTNALDNYNYAY